ncbi:beta-ketoacyl synthase N-terminal-like domain-containing protein [Pyxidicoccus trucidator]|uniref:beta-ketoacyl synthase N-terminal-like domain-containing protein n=1 Tax=Pyxidicoccus trucidator TaxID=2709662 RepID=UPI0013DB3BA8|nr:beta-ketoacyl synthase N-terminal-like domain-containing protein [Pyxidicoccus trucidator]
MTEIAIIGMAGTFPGAGEDLERFADLLDAGTDLVGPVSAERKRDAGVPEDVDVPPVALLERIDAFDPAFFGLSQWEAEHMDPQHRLALELACRAVYDAGHGPRSLRGSRTAVVLSPGRAGYSELLGETGSALSMGNLQAAAAGRISYLLDLRGPAFVIDTACSSALAAVHLACGQLRAGVADLALAGGVACHTRLFTWAQWGVGGVMSPRGRTRAFDADADGMGAGEGGALVLLKRLPDALRDGDPIRAVILGSVTTQDGGRSNGLAAPSPVAQTETVRLAWRDARVQPESISFIEAHGAGTRIGDPIELQGLAAAFGEQVSRRGACAIGSVKANIGHLDAAAGIAGLVKAVLSLERRRLFPTAHFQKPNPLVDLAASPLRVCTRGEDWEGPRPRRAGVNAFGISGTNVHVVLQEAPEPHSPREDAPEPWLFPLSARSDGQLRQLCQRLATHLERRAEHPRDISFVLGVGRDHGPHRMALVARTLPELLAALRAGSVQAGAVAPAEARPVVFLVSGDARLSPAARERLGAEPRFREAHAECARAARAASEVSTAFADLYALIRFWESLGVSAEVMMGTGLAHHVIDAVLGQCSLEEALSAAATDAGAPLAVERLREALATLAEQRPVFLDLAGGSLPDVVARAGTATLVRGAGGSRTELLEALARLYEAGGAVDFTRLHSGRGGRRVSLPGPPFARTRCWPALEPVRAPERPVPMPSTAPSPSEGGSARERIRGFVAARFSTEDFSDEESLLQNGIIDSMGVMEFVSFLEREFAIIISDMELLPENLESVQQAVAFVARKRAHG